MDRITNIDKLRGAACLLIVLFHIYALTGLVPINIPYIENIIKAGGEIGVTTFFLLSGYGIYYSIKGLQHKGRISFTNFIKGRIIRIVPHYYFNLLSLLLLSSSVVYLTKKHIINIIMHLIFMHSFSFDWHGAINGSLWTMAIIFQFYIFAIPLFLVVNKLIKSRLTTIILIVLSFTFTVAAKYIILNYLWVEDIDVYGDFTQSIPGRQLITSLDNFVYGMIIAAINVEFEHKIYKRMKMFIALIATVLIVVLATFFLNYGHSSAFIYIKHGLMGLSVMLLLYGLSFKTDDSNYISKMLLFFGKHEYGVYLWHLPILKNIIGNEDVFSWLRDKNGIIVYLLLLVATLPFGIIMDKLFSDVGKNINGK